MRKFMFLGLFYLSLLPIGYVGASELKFEFVNPAFGGNPLNSTFLLQTAQMQNSFKEETKFPFQEQSLIDRFVNSFTNQLLYRMSDYVLDQIFGADGVPSDQPQRYQIGSFIIEYDPTGGTYKFTITDLSTGQSTTIEVPRVI